jgi:hypothetical protein
MRNSSKITRSPVTGPWYDTKQKSLVNVSHLIDFHEDEGPVKHPSPPSTQNATQQQASTEQPRQVGRLHLRRLTPPQLRLLCPRRSQQSSFYLLRGVAGVIHDQRPRENSTANVRRVSANHDRPWMSDSQK